MIGVCEVCGEKAELHDVDGWQMCAVCAFMQAFVNAGELEPREENDDAEG